MRNLFIHPIERRLRSFWRLLIFLIVFFAISIGFQLFVGVVLGIWLLLTGQLTMDMEALQAMVVDNPIILFLGAFGSLLAIGLCYFGASRWLDRRPIPDFGLRFRRAWWRDFLFGLILGAVLIAGMFGVELAAGWIQAAGPGQYSPAGSPFWPAIFLYIGMFICVGIYEEMLSRGYLMRNLAEGLKSRWLPPKAALLIAFLLSSSFFGALHAGNPNATLTSTVCLIGAGLLLGFGYYLTGELSIPIGLHITWNFFEGNVFGFPVSGMASSARFLDIRQTGPEAITGGAFGPEAGLIGLGAIVVGCLLILLWVRLTRGTVGPEERLAVYTPPNAGKT